MYKFEQTVVHPYYLGAEDFSDITLVYKGEGYGSYKEQTDASPAWLKAGENNYFTGGEYRKDVIRVIQDGKSRIYDYDGNVITEPFNTFNRDDILNCYVYDEDKNSNKIKYFDKDFKMKSEVAEGIGGDLGGDGAVYSQGKIYTYNSVVDYKEYNDSEAEVIPVKNKYSLQEENEMVENNTFLKDPDGFVVLDKDKLIELPKGMKPVYYDEVINKDLWSDKDYSYNTAFVNEVIKLTDGDGIRLYDINKEDFVTDDKYEDATYCEKGIIGVKKSGKWAFMNKDGKLITQYVFNKVSAVYNNKAYVQRNINGNKVGIIKLEVK